MGGHNQTGRGGGQKEHLKRGMEEGKGTVISKGFKPSMDAGRRLRGSNGCWKKTMRVQWLLEEDYEGPMDAGRRLRGSNGC